MTLALAVYNYYCDWSNNGTFGEANEDITAYVLSAQWEYGVDWSSVPGRSKIGACRIKLDNSTGIFSSYNSGSPIQASLLPGRAVKVTMTIAPAAAVTMWYGYLESILPTPGAVVGISTAELLAYGPLSQLNDDEIHLALQTDHDTGALVTHCLDAASYSASLRDIDTGLSTLSKFFVLRDSSAIGVLRELEDAECGLIRETKDGKIAFEARDHRIVHHGIPAPTTFGSGGLFMWDLSQEDPLKGICNSVEADVRTFNASEDATLAVIVDIRNSQGGAAIPIAGSGGIRNVTISFPTANSPSQYIAVNDWGVITYECNTAADITGTDITSDVAAVKTEYADRVEIVFTNNNVSAGYIVVLKANGTAIVEGDPVPVKASDATSQTKYRRRIYPSPSRWLTDIDVAEDYTAHLLALYKDPESIRRISFELKANYDATHLLKAQSLDVSDRIHIDATVALYSLGIDQDFFIEYVRHKVDAASIHTVQFDCRAAVTDVWAASGTAYADKTVPEGVPDDLYVNAIDPDLHLVFGARAWKYNQNITGARFRARYYTVPLGSGETADLRTVAEGGTMSHNPAGGMYVVDTPFFANQYGAQYEFDSTAAGVWYFAFQFTSNAGDSVWTDGNKKPRYVENYVDAISGQSANGPPEDWWVEVIPAPDGSHRVIVKASRPKVNGAKIWAWVAQIKDNRTGTWRRVSENTSGLWALETANILYGDINDSGYGDLGHASSNNNTRLTRTSANPHGGLRGMHSSDYVRIGDLILFDPRGGQWEEKHCQWGTVDTIQGLKSGYNVATASYFDVIGRFHNTVTADLRLLVVNAPWGWTRYQGYFGQEQNHGLYERWYWDNGEHGDTTTQIFTSDPIDVPADVPLANVEARVWFDNGYSRYDGGLITGGMAGDSGNPSGATGLTILTNADDSTIPAGFIALEWNRETANYKNIYVVAAWVSAALPGEGPYDTERDGHPTCVLKHGTCTITAGNKSITVIRNADPSVVGKAFLIYTDDASPDSDLDGNIVTAEGTNSITLSAPFNKSGTYSYAIVKCWWDLAGGDTTNAAYYQWDVKQVTFDVEKAKWRTPPFPMPSGSYYITLANRNAYGLGTRLTTASPHNYTSSGCVPLSVSGGAVATNTDLGRVFSISAGASFTLSNPTGTHYCGMTVLWFITGSGEPTLGDKFLLAEGETIDKSSGCDMLAAIYNAAEDQWNAFFKQGGAGGASASGSVTPSSSPSATPSLVSGSLSASPSATPSGLSASPSSTQSPSSSISASPSIEESGSVSSSTSKSASAS